MWIPRLGVWSCQVGVVLFYTKNQSHIRPTRTRPEGEGATYGVWQFLEVVWEQMGRMYGYAVATILLMRKEVTKEIMWIPVLLHWSTSPSTMWTCGNRIMTLWRHGILPPSLFASNGRKAFKPISLVSSLVIKQSFSSLSCSPNINVLVFLNKPYTYSSRL